MISGIGLTLLNVWGLVAGPAEHPRVIAGEIHKNGLSGVSYHESLARLAAVGTAPLERRLAEITEVFARRLRHYWPAANEVDAQVFHGLHENWWLALRQHVEALLVRAGWADVDLARIERRDYRASLGKGVGYCSQASLALADYLDEIGLPALIVPLGGHVVAATSVGERMFALDADYNAAFEVKGSRPSEWAASAELAYARAGYPPPKAAQLAALYSQSNAEGAIEVERYMRGWRRELRQAAVLSWVLPFVMMGAAWNMLRRRPATPTARS
jgi:hypothetical protein